jgi:uncharacterized membrane protein YqhA
LILYARDPGSPPTQAAMFERLLKIRYLALVIVILAILHSVAFLVLGARIAVAGYWHVLHRTVEQGGNSRPGLELLHGLDFLFVSMVLMVLALGIAKLFLLDFSGKTPPALPQWLRIESITELKVLLWEAILTTLVIIALSDLSEGLFVEQGVKVLLIPAAILILSLSLFFMKKT